MNYKQWLEAHPSVFPELMQHQADSTPFQNPIIGDSQEQTYQKVQQVVDFFTQMALPSRFEPADLSMDENATWGFITILVCLSGAMNFEQKYRPDGGETDEKEKRNDADNKQKVSFNPFHGMPYKDYQVACVNAEGVEKDLSIIILAPTSELALAKARENYSATLKEGQVIIVKECSGKKKKTAPVDITTGDDAS